VALTEFLTIITVSSIVQHAWKADPSHLSILGSAGELTPLHPGFCGLANLSTLWILQISSPLHPWFCRSAHLPTMDSESQLTFLPPWVLLVRSPSTWIAVELTSLPWVADQLTSSPWVAGQLTSPLWVAGQLNHPPWVGGQLTPPPWILNISPYPQRGFCTYCSSPLALHSAGQLPPPLCVVWMSSLLHPRFGRSAYPPPPL
jgi:hypothetical protein